MNDGPRLAPHQPPLSTGDLPGAGGAVGPEPEDFVVDELPLHPASGSGPHWHVRVRKRLWTTPEMLQVVARAAGVAERDLGHAGMKDKHAVTTQWISLPEAARAPESWSLPDGVQMLEATRHEKKIRTGQLRGNRFRVHLVSPDPAAFERAEAICDRLRQHGLPNAFGEQRFGRGGANLERAIGWLSRGAPLAGKRARFYKKFYPSVIQSEVFNRYLTARLELGARRLIAGEVVRLDGSASVFVVEEPEAELRRLESGDIHLTGPIVGPRMKRPEGRPLELELGILEELGLSEENLTVLGRLAAGTRRDLLVMPEDLAIRKRDDGLELAFTLPPGSYATWLIREVTHGE